MLQRPPALGGLRICLLNWRAGAEARGQTADYRQADRRFCVLL